MVCISQRSGLIIYKPMLKFLRSSSRLARLPRDEIDLIRSDQGGVVIASVRLVLRLEVRLRCGR